MNKKSIVKEVAKRTDYRQPDVTYVIETFIDVLRESATEGKKININGFLSIDTVDYKQTNMYVPSEGKVVSIPARRKLKATLSPLWELRD